MKKHLTRRRFLATLGATAGVGIAGKSLFNISKVLAQGPYVRPNVAGLTITSPAIVSYIAGIQAMQALPVTNPLSWAYQAAIHGTTMAGMNAGWNTCAHGNDFFWSWHRMYLYWFERIVRSQSGDSTFALPFWDWQTNPTLPSMFQNTGSPTLHVAARNVTINSGVGGVGNQTPGVNTAFAQPIYEGASGAVSLIQSPHGSVHVNVGGWMSSILTAAQDPIFYLHHANCDRLWNLWLAQGGLQSDPTSDTAWGSQVFVFFDENGNQQNMTSCDVLRAAQQLGYSYEGEPAQVNQYCGNPPLCNADYHVLIDNCIGNPPFYLAPGPYQYFYFDVDPQLAKQILGYIKQPGYTVYMQYYGVTAPTQPGITWDVYVGLPIGTKPKPGSPYYVGTYGMYGAGIADQPPDGNDPASFSFPLNVALAKTLKKNQLKVPVTFFPSGVRGLSTGGPSQKSTPTIQQAQLTLQVVTPTGTAGTRNHEEAMRGMPMTHK